MTQYFRIHCRRYFGITWDRYLSLYVRQRTLVDYVDQLKAVRRAVLNVDIHASVDVENGIAPQVCLECIGLQAIVCMKYLSVEVLLNEFPAHSVIVYIVLELGVRGDHLVH